MTDCHDYVPCKRSAYTTEKSCATCEFGQKSMSECTLADGTWKDDYKEVRQ
jgi:hypothetical protein